MERLPSGYKKIQNLGGWIDTGISANSNISFDLVIEDRVNNTSDFNGGIFGARDSNSNTATKQVNIFEYAQGFYFGYNNGRTPGITKANPGISYGEYDGTIRITSNKNEVSINYDCAFTKEASRTSAVFSGGRNLYLGAVNNGGTADRSYAPCYWCKIYENDTLLRHYIPGIRESDNAYGFYDLVNNTFDVVNDRIIDTSGEMIVTTSDGGDVYGDIGYFRVGKLTAYAEKGYSFLGWYENGTLLSQENPYYYRIYGVKTYEARFVKIADIDFSSGFRLMVKNRYSLTNGITTEMQVISGEVAEDGLQRTTSKFTVKDVPTNVKPENIVLLYTPRNTKIYQGIIQTIEGNEITCREELAYFDTPFLFHDNTNLPYTGGIDIANLSTINLQVALAGYIKSVMGNDRHTEITSSSYVTSRRYAGLEIQYAARYKDNFVDVNFPLYTDTNNKNFEDFLFEMFRDFGVLTKITFNPINNYSTYNGYITVGYNNDTMVVSDNVETISNVSVKIEYADTNLIYIYNSNGTTYRDTLSASNVNTDSWEWSIPCKEQLIMSDDSIKTLKEQYITNVYNHQITFDINFNNLYGIDDFVIGKKVRFYKSDQLYDSVITGVKFSFGLDDDVKSATVTLGNVRSNLTSKLNLGKVK